MSQTPNTGKLLIAEPFMGDPNFERSVVLLCEHNEEGSFGLVLNQQTEITLKEIWEDTSFPDMPLYLGGPVEKNTLHFIHSLGELIPESILVAPNLYWGGDYEQVRSLLNIGKIQENDIRFFIGYSGWGAGQLDHEMKRNAWMISETDGDFILKTPVKEFWRSVLKKMGGKYKAISNYPTDPRLN